MNGAYQDTTLRTVNATSATVAAGTTMTTYADIIRRLPTGFPIDRNPRKLRTEGPILTAWAEAGLAGANAARLHARCAATPVIVIGHSSRLDGDAQTLEAIWPKTAAFIDVGRGLQGWFRHPVLVCDPRTEPVSWLKDCCPALIVCDGAAAWRSLLRRAFPTAAHLLVVDRRSPAAVDLVDEICATSPTTEPFKPDPPRGVEGWRIHEPVIAPVLIELDVDEDLI